MALNSKSAAIFVIAAGSALLAQVATIPPVAKRVEHREVRHETTVIDNYFWLREKSNRDVIRFHEAENARTENVRADRSGKKMRSIGSA